MIRLRTSMQLIRALCGRGSDEATVEVHVHTRIVTGILQSVQRESGDGRCFNLTILKADMVTETVFWRSED